MTKFAWKMSQKMTQKAENSRKVARILLKYTGKDIFAKEDKRGSFTSLRSKKDSFKTNK